MSKVKMTEDRIKAIIASYGANADHWPANERREAHAFLTNTPHLKVLVDEARAIDNLLNVAPKPAEVNDAFLAKVMAVSELPQKSRARRTKHKSKGLFAFFGAIIPAGSLSFMPQAASIAIAGFLGVYMGLSDIQRPAQPVEMVDASSLIFENPGLRADLKEFE